jgi:hypothetical protein
MNIVGVTGHSGAGKDIIAARLAEKHGYVQLAIADPLKRFGLNVFGLDVIQLWGSAKNTIDPMFQECNIRSSGVTFEPGCKLANVKRACDPHWGAAAVRLSSYGPTWVAELVPVAEREQALRDLFFWFASLGHHYPAFSPRIMLQNLGTEWGREVVDKDIWVNKMVNTAEQVLAGTEYSRETGLTDQQLSKPSGVVVSDVRFDNELDVLKKIGGKVVRVKRDASDRKSKTVGIASHASEMAQDAFVDDKFDCILSNNGSIADLNNAVDVAALTFKGNK